MEDVDEDNRSSADMTLIFLFIVSSILVTVDIIEIHKIIQDWKYGIMIVPNVFENCLKWELGTKTVFGVFSLGAAFSAFVLSLGLLVNPDKFVAKFLDTFLCFNWVVFGPQMLAFSILALCYWNNVVYVCDKNNIDNKIIIASTVFSIFMCLIISAVLVIFKSAYETVLLINDSVTRSNGGNSIIRKLFWYYAYRNRNEINNTV